MSAETAPLTDSRKNWLSATIAGFLGHDTHGAIVALAMEPSPFTSRFPAEIVTVRLRDGRERRLFVKRFGTEEADHPDKQRRDREILVYEQLLDTDQPAPNMLGWRVNPADNRRELFLDFVPDWDLRYQDLDIWYEAARALAGLHGHFASNRDQLERSDFLLRFDAPYFAAWAQRALASVGEVVPSLKSRVGAIVESYGVVAELLGGQPSTLVHNDLGPKNIMADRAYSPPELYLVDWEMAGVGCGYLDLVTLKYGLPREADERMQAAYLEALGDCDLRPHSTEALNRILAACELHRTMLRLWRNRVWNLPASEVAGWVEEAESWLDSATGAGS